LGQVPPDTPEVLIAVAEKVPPQLSVALKVVAGGSAFAQVAVIVAGQVSTGATLSLIVNI
jgi:hypothetical protein